MLNDTILSWMPYLNLDIPIYIILVISFNITIFALILFILTWDSNPIPSTSFADALPLNYEWQFIFTISRCHFESKFWT